MSKLAVAACLFGLAVAVVLTVTMATPASRALVDGRDLGRLAWIAMYGAYALVILSSTAYRYRGRFAVALGHLLVWALLFLGFVVLYAFKDDLGAGARRVLSSLLPGHVDVAQNGDVSVVRGLDGQFDVDGYVNDIPVRLTFDTGASTIELRAEDADRVGLPVSGLTYSTPVETANGETMAASVVLKSVRVGDIVEKNQLALVAKPGALDQSLLGRNFLDQLSGYSVESSRLVLRAP